MREHRPCFTNEKKFSRVDFVERNVLKRNEISREVLRSESRHYF
jgi:hypothetical protein